MNTLDMTRTERLLYEQLILSRVKAQDRIEDYNLARDDFAGPKIVPIDIVETETT